MDLRVPLRALLWIAVPLVVLVVAPGTFFGFDLPKAAAVTVVGAAGVAPAVWLLAGRWHSLPTAARVLLAASLVLALWTLLGTAVSGAAVMALIGEQGRFVGGASLAAAAVATLIAAAGPERGLHIERTLDVLAVTLLAFNLYVLIQVLGLDPGPWSRTWSRPVGTVGNPNFVGAIAALGVPVAAGWWLLRSHPAWRVAAAVLAAGSLHSVWAASSRLGLVAVVVAVLVLTAGLARVPARLRSVPGLVLAAAPVGGVVAGSAAVGLGVLLNDRDAVARWEFWATSLSMLRGSPVLGVGPGRYLAHYSEHLSAASSRRIGQDLDVDSAHAFVFDLLATTGAVGLLSWLTCLVAAGLLLRGLWSHEDDQRRRARLVTLAALLGAHGAQAATSIPTVASVWLGFVFLGLVVAETLLDQPLGARHRSSAARRRRAERQRRAVALVGLVGLVVSGLAVVGPLRTSLLLVDVEFGRATGDVRIEGLAAARAVEATPCWTRPRRGLAQAQGNVGDLASSEQTLLETLERCDPRDVAAMEMLAQLADAQGDTEEAAGWYGRILDLSPSLRQRNRTVARWAVEAGERDLALRAADQLDAVIAPDQRGYGSSRELIEEVRATFGG